MFRGPLYREGYKPQLSGHETFPLRYGWLKKVFDAVRSTEDEGDNRFVFISKDAIARFGVGKNMVSSMRHWATASGIIEETNVERHIGTTRLGRLLFDSDGVDPYMESPDTSWLIHWQLSGRPHKTTWFWAFNHYPALSFNRDMLVRGIEVLANDLAWSRASVATIRRDVSCFVRTYVPQFTSRHVSFEDALESPLTELGLVKPVGRRDGFRFVRGQKPSLGTHVFCYAVTDFWNEYFPNANTLSFEALAHEPGSPGRVFQLDEDALVEKLFTLESATDGAYQWSETAGLQQIVRARKISAEDVLSWMAHDSCHKLDYEDAR